MARGVVELESKHRIIDLASLVERLERLGYHGAAPVRQVDEYFDTPASALAGHDFVVRLRLVDSTVTVGFKGPRVHHDDGTYSRVEVEVPGADHTLVRDALHEQHLVPVRRIVKDRRYFGGPGSIVVALDQLPNLGHYVEFEGPSVEIRDLVRHAGDAIGPAESRNYHELLVDWCVRHGRDPAEADRASFEDG